jgi:hypothetical protein
MGDHAKLDPEQVESTFDYIDYKVMPRSGNKKTVSRVRRWPAIVEGN